MSEQQIPEEIAHILICKGRQSGNTIAFHDHVADMIEAYQCGIESSNGEAWAPRPMNFPEDCE